MNKKFLIPAIICLLLCILCILLCFRSCFPFEYSGNTSEHSAGSDQAEEISSQMEEKNGSELEQSEVEDEQYVSPIDFDTLQAGNPDIYAWIFIEDSSINFPILQNEDDAFYLSHNADKKPADYGAIYTEKTYTPKSFDEPLTVIYGHRMYSGAMFGALQIMYSSQENLEKYHEIIIYTPEQELHYQVFAAVPYDNRHISYHYGDGTARGMMSFLQSVSSVKSINAYFDKDAFATLNDKIIVLSTCLYGDQNRRFLVVAKQI